MSEPDQYAQAVTDGHVALRLLADATVDGDDGEFQAAVEIGSLHLMSASLHASLAQVDAIRDLTAAVREFRRGA